MIRTFVRVAVGVVLLGCFSASAQTRQSKDVLHDTAACNDPSGVEIKLTKKYTASPGYFFSKFTTTFGPTRNFVNFAGSPDCRILSSEKVAVPATIGGIKTQIEVATSNTVYAHSDCGSGEARTAQHIAKGESIEITCNIEWAEMKLPFK